MRVYNMYSPKGNPVPNQFVIEDNGKICFQSYNSIIAIVDKANKIIKLGADVFYSRTTDKYRNIFFNDEVCLSGLSTSSALRKAIDKGEYEDYKVVVDYAL